MQKRYMSLKVEYKREGCITGESSAKAKTYVTEMYKHADNHYLEMKYGVENANKTDRVAKEITRTMRSIKGYKEKILNICDYK